MVGAAAAPAAGRPPGEALAFPLAGGIRNLSLLWGACAGLVPEATGLLLQWGAVATILAPTLLATGRKVALAWPAPHGAKPGRERVAGPGRDRMAGMGPPRPKPSAPASRDGAPIAPAAPSPGPAPADPGTLAAPPRWHTPARPAGRETGHSRTAQAACALTGPRAVLRKEAGLFWGAKYTGSKIE